MGEKGCTILIADDEPEVVDLVRIVLEAAGYTVIAAADGEQALAQARAHKPDLILLDIRMPKMSGLTVLNYFRQDPALTAIPVIMLSVVTTYPEIRSALEQGAIAYISKPFELREMVRLIDRVLAMNAAGRENLRQHALSDIGKR